MGFNEAVVHDLIVLESDMLNVEKELKKLKRVNVIQWVAIGYLLCKVGKNSGTKVVHEEKIKEKYEKWFDKRREK